MKPAMSGIYVRTIHPVATDEDQFCTFFFVVEEKGFVLMLRFNYEYCLKVDVKLMSW